jgi:hypothetical protein
VQRHTRLRVYNVLAKPPLVYGSEAWTAKKQDEKRLEAAEMRFVRRTAGHIILDKKRNKHILEEFQVERITTYLQQDRAQWKSHIERMTDTRWPKLITSYKPPGKRSLGRPLKRWSETVTSHQDQKLKDDDDILCRIMIIIYLLERLYLLICCYVSSSELYLQLAIRLLMQHTNNKMKN